MDNSQRGSDDEEDLEMLRLAALQTLKKPSQASSERSTLRPRNNTQPLYRQEWSRGKFLGKRAHFYPGRGHKNGQFRVVSSNLISLTPSSPSEGRIKLVDSKKDTLVLSQDKYSQKTSEEKSDEVSSKFDRYKDSDTDEDDSEDEALKTDSEDDGTEVKLERSNSLEALMQELDAEIKGSKNEKKPVKAKAKLKIKKVIVKTEQMENDADTKKIDVPESDVKTVPSDEEKIEIPAEVVIDETKQSSPKTIVKDTIKPNEKSPSVEPHPKKRRYSPPHQRTIFSSQRGRGKSLRHNPPPFMHTPNPAPVPFIPVNPSPIFSNPPFVQPTFTPPLFFERPLHIDTETLQTQTLAPLSPRSAAFVLQNREIIEKRKRSPRRSYSRSPSPRRRSLSPRRSPAPLIRRSLSPRKRSVSPRRRSMSPLRKRSRSPKRRSVSPKRRSPSPKRRNISPKQRAVSPKLKPLSPDRRLARRRSPSPRKRDRKEPPEILSKTKPNVRDRLGLKPDEKEKSSQSDPIPKKEEIPEKPLDPILEARKKKFETGEIKVREGVIRLKPKEEVKSEETAEVKEEIISPQQAAEVQEKKDVFNEDALLMDDELDLVVESNDLFSDEESGSENEGRFKVELGSVEKPTTVPYSKLANGTIQEIKTSVKEKKPRVRSRSPHELKKDSSRSRKYSLKASPPDSTKRSSKSRLEKSVVKNKLGVKTERHPKRFERKIEIKIKNPSKYEAESDQRAGRKVELGIASEKCNLIEENDEEDDTEIVVENDEDEVENNIVNEGDLRAQLSKKRAEKLQKTTTRESVTSRLLQNALQNALPLKKPKKSKSSKKELSNCELAALKSLFTADFISSRLQLTVHTKRHVTIYKPKRFKFSFERRPDGKLPIHLRLGLASGSDEVQFSKPKRKSKKRKTTDEDLHQV